MNAADIIAYTADADAYCPGCAEKLYGILALAQCPECGHYLYPGSDNGVCRYCEFEYGSIPTDNEGNEVHPIFCDNMGEWAESGLSCGHCHEVIVEKE